MREEHADAEERFTDSPDDEPAFCDPDRAESFGYIGADDVPTFDTELAGLPELDEDLTPRGKGPTPGYEARWSEIARLHALGYTNNQIARHLGYSAPGISLALHKPFVQSEIARWRAKYFSQETADVIKDSARDAAVRIGKLVRDPNTKDALAFQAGAWLVEKATGKAKQEVSLESGTLNNFMDLLKDMQSCGEVLDVTPQTRALAPLPAATQIAEPDPVDRWIAENL